jgi:hypothetical protein
VKIIPRKKIDIEALGSEQVLREIFKLLELILKELRKVKM